MNGHEVVEHNGRRYAEVLRTSARVETTKFFSPPESSFQFGLLAHEAGFVEEPHYHREFSRTISDLQQMFVVQRGVVEVDLYDDEGGKIASITLRAGDGIVLIHGVHAIRVIEDMQCISVKQGPFMGVEFDKVPVKVDS